MAAAAILDYGKIAITSPGIDWFGSKFVCRYKIATEIGRVTNSAIYPKFKMAAAA